MPKQLPGLLQAALTANGGAATLAELDALGVSRGQVARLVRDGALIRVARGCYLLPPPEDIDYWEGQRRQHLRALTVALTPDAAAGLRTAAVLRMWPVSQVPPLPEVVRPPHAARRKLTRTVCTALAAAEVDLIDGLRVTSMVRTCVDVALDLPAPEALITLDAALRRGVNRLDLLSALDRRGPVPNVQRARQTISWADGFSESPVESRGRGTLMVNGVTRPECNLTFEFQGERFRPDDWWVGTGLIGEADGRVKYERLGSRGRRPDENADGRSETLWQEKLRQQWFEAELGMTVYRWTDREMRLAPGRAAKRWFTLAALPSVRLWTPPTGLRIYRA